MRGVMERSLSLTGLWGAHALAPGGVREQIEACAALGYRAVQLDGAEPGVRPRELDRSARRDLAALLKRSGLAISGIDLWIPARHFTDPSQSDRAVSAVEACCQLAAELAGLVGPLAGLGDGKVVCLALPEKCPTDVLAHLDAAAMSVGVTIADHAWPSGATRRGGGAVRFGVDPGAIMFSGADPVAEVSRLKEAPASARLTDLSPSGRVEPGSEEGRLDAEAYDAALHVRGWRGPVVIDLRGLPDIAGAARRLAPPKG